MIIMKSDGKAFYENRYNKIVNFCIRFSSYYVCALVYNLPWEDCLLEIILVMDKLVIRQSSGLIRRKRCEDVQEHTRSY